MKRLKPKISVIGGGNVGIRYAYALMLKGVAREIVIVDINRNRLEGDVMDLSHGEPYIEPVKIAAGDYSDTKGSDLVVITAGAKQKPGQTRLELVSENVNIFKKIIPVVMKYSPEAIILVVTNPVDVLSYVTYKISGKPSGEVIGSGTVLDTARFRHLLAKHCRIDPRNVHAYILGEHGDSEFPVWSKAMFGGVSISEYCPYCSNYNNCNHSTELNKIFESVRDSAYIIIERKGETSYGIGLAMVRITQAIVNDENSILPVSSYVDDFYGVSDVYIGVPTVLNRSGVREILKIKLNKDEIKSLRKSAEIIKKTIKSVGF